MLYHTKEHFYKHIFGAVKSLFFGVVVMVIHVVGRVVYACFALLACV